MSRLRTECATGADPQTLDTAVADCARTQLIEPTTGPLTPLANETPLRTTTANASLRVESLVGCPTSTFGSPKTTFGRDAQTGEPLPLDLPL